MKKDRKGEERTWWLLAYRQLVEQILITEQPMALFLCKQFHNAASKTNKLTIIRSTISGGPLLLVY